MDDRADEGLVGGRYRVLARARTDPHTITFRAEDSRSGEAVALVVLRAPAENREAAAEAFRLAAGRLAALDHPALPAVLDIGRDRGVDYAVTEWPGDIALSQLILKSRGLSIPRVVDTGLQLCAVFSFLRQSGIAPTGLSTADIALDAQGNARITPAALVSADQAAGDPQADAARIVAMLREMTGGITTPAPEIIHIVQAKVYPDAASLAGTLAAYWHSRWRALPNRPAFRTLALREPPPSIAPKAATAPPSRRGWDAPGIILLAAALAAMLGTIPLWATVYARYARPVAVAPLPAAQSPDSIVVPDLTGLDEATARNLLEQAGLRLEVVGVEYSDLIPLGRAMTQDPIGGQRTQRGTAVRVILSQGSAKTTVPDVVGKAYSDAEAALAQSNLNASRLEVWSESASEVVLAQEPPAGTPVIPGTTVSLRVSSGRTMSLNATLGDVARLLTVEVDRGTLRPGETVRITLRWQALRPVQNRLSVFVHLIGPDGTLVTQDDGEPARGSRPTSTWAAGEIISDPHALTLPPGAAAGEYTVRVGLYLPGPNERLPVIDAGRAEVQDNALTVHRITAVP
jgi:serine/threonine-protein kinase